MRWVMTGWLALAAGLPGSAWATACSTMPWPSLACDGQLEHAQIWSTDPSQIIQYPTCTGSLSQPGPEWIFEYPCPGNTQVTLKVSNTDCDVDLYVLAEDCSPLTGCQKSSTQISWGPGLQETLWFSCAAGETRWVVLEGFDLTQNPTRCPWGAGIGSYRYTDADILATCVEICDDGVDNDLDLLIDCDDPECSCGEDCSQPGDEDLDGVADCADFDCLGEPVCCDEDLDGVPAARAACGGADCDDEDDQIFPGATETPNDRVDQDCSGGDSCWQDLDRDSYGSTLLADSPDIWCIGHVGLANDDDDCDDTSSLIRPGVPDLPGDGIDQNCDTVDACWRDVDGDGFGAGITLPGPGLDCDAFTGWAARGGDCLDSGTGASQSYPGATEICDGVDNDCDFLIDGADPSLVGGGSGTAWPDGDGDGYGRSTGSITVTGCAIPTGYAAFSGDCDDANPARSPGRAEVPYDGIDQDCSGLDLTDLDGDGHDGPSATGPDCDDNHPLVHPGRAETADGVDQDCDGLVDEGTRQGDDDGDGRSESGGDCDDTRADVRVGGTEVCDGLDNDCDGVRDDGTECRDDDSDGFTELIGDCNDADPRVNPGRSEIAGNGLDDDCDGFTDSLGVDFDRDGFAAFAGDCDDRDDQVSPIAPEVPDGLDNDCNGRIDEGTDRTDDDFDGWSEVTGDCYDGNPAVYPGAPEQLNGIDDDCNGRVDDAGPFGDLDRDGWSVDDGDCNDTDRLIHPDAAEVADSVDQDCDGAVDEGTFDVDEDGVLAELDCDDNDGWRSPDLSEMCGDATDNDCDGEVDEACATSAPADETKRSCANTSGTALASLLAMLWTRRRIRR